MPDRLPQRIQRKREKGWRMPKGAVYVGRPSKWGNPYRVSDYRFETPDGRPVRDEIAAREMALRDFSMWLGCTPVGEAMAEAAKRELRGKRLACWCPIGMPCHADELLEIANA